MYAHFLSIFRFGKRVINTHGKTDYVLERVPASSTDTKLPDNAEQISARFSSAETMKHTFEDCLQEAKRTQTCLSVKQPFFVPVFVWNQKSDLGGRGHGAGASRGGKAPCTPPCEAAVRKAASQGLMKARGLGSQGPSPGPCAPLSRPLSGSRAHPRPMPSAAKVFFLF